LIIVIFFCWNEDRGFEGEVVLFGGSNGQYVPFTLPKISLDNRRVTPPEGEK